jgi:uncharacterized protein YndB with AHSA1/START domain
MKRQELVITRHLNAPRDLVWKAFTDADHLAAWWGPPGTTLRHSALDLRPGGRYHFRSEFPDGNALWGLFVFHEISPQDRIVYLHSFSDKDGGIASSPFGGPWPACLHTTLSFVEAEGGTTLSLHQYPIDATSEEDAAYGALLEDMTGGWSGTLDRLDDFLRGKGA